TVMRRSLAKRLLLLGILGLLAGCSTFCKHRGVEKGRLPLPTGTPKRPVGLTALAAKPGATPFSKDDVAAYFKAHNLPKNLGLTDQFQVDSLEFVTSGEVKQRLQGESTGLKDEERVGFATLSGTFIFTGPPGRSATFRRAYAVFDAGTGNLLMIGSLAE